VQCENGGENLRDKKDINDQCVWRSEREKISEKRNFFNFCVIKEIFLVLKGERIKK
jgi:hypothetical protein